MKKNGRCNHEAHNFNSRMSNKAQRDQRARQQQLHHEEPLGAGDADAGQKFNFLT
ncbi:conserved hypothetical protein [Ricinus communis]|uniref:Uncharacterized protein n=1 Tax=Ricinus communis TaxID=3988 RepID=B9S4L1_RICCO|nr:conserved hypothetical protein [Ricinus communis]